MQLAAISTGYDVNSSFLDYVHAVAILTLTDDDLPIFIMFAQARHFYGLAFLART